MNRECKEFYKFVYNHLESDGCWIFPDSGSIWTKKEDGTMRRLIDGDETLDNRVKSDLVSLGYNVEM